jgi:hypothetical protein
VAQPKLVLVVGGILLSCAILTADTWAQDRQACAEAKQELHARRQKLAEYIGALQNFQKKSDWTLAEIFSKEITRMIADIRQFTENLNCPDEHKASPGSGLSPVKVDMGTHATKSCAELKQTLVQLLVSTSAPRRRERAYASPLTRDEKRELKRNMRELEKVRNALRARCSGARASSPRSQ